ncbi:hypothetical protein, partial [Bifidobacterium aesculapii]|uniref:hypothetical protein n=1 Tax=Bifidobacterium aesculapii TaxID=1329411 RepID=UPI001F36BDC3
KEPTNHKRKEPQAPSGNRRLTYTNPHTNANRHDKTRRKPLETRRSTGVSQTQHQNHTYNQPTNTHHTPNPTISHTKTPHHNQPQQFTHQQPKQPKPPTTNPHPQHGHQPTATYPPMVR